MKWRESIAVRRINALVYGPVNGKKLYAKCFGIGVYIVFLFTFIIYTSFARIQNQVAIMKLPFYSVSRSVLVLPASCFASGSEWTFLNGNILHGDQRMRETEGSRSMASSSNKVWGKFLSSSSQMFEQSALLHILRFNRPKSFVKSI